MSHVGGTELIEQDDDEEYLYCGICMHKYDLHLMRPKILPCSHTFCFTCLQTIHSGTGNSTLKCPLCKRIFEMTDVLTLPNNKYVQHIVHLNNKLRNIEIQQNPCSEVACPETPTTTKKLRVIDWGCFGSFMLGRNEPFVKIITAQNPDIVFFYGINRKIINRLKRFFPRFKLLSQNMGTIKERSRNPAFAPYLIPCQRVTMLNYATVTYDSHENIILPTAAHDAEYYDVCTPNLQHHFTILKVEARFGPMKLKLLNTHLNVLESRKNHRPWILKAILEEVRNTDNTVNVIMGVGKYLSDKELINAGGLPGRMVDMWEACGKPTKCKNKFILDDAGLSTESLSEENFTADWTRLEYLFRTDQFFLCPASTGKVAVPQRFGVIGIPKHSDFEHSVMVVDMKVKN